MAYRSGIKPIKSKWVDSSGSWKLKMWRKTAKYSCSTGALSIKKKFFSSLGINFSTQAKANASSLKLSTRKGANSESKPCQYTSFLLSATHALSSRRSLACPAEDAKSGLYWWQRGTSDRPALWLERSTFSIQLRQYSTNQLQSWQFKTHSISSSTTSY